MTARVSPFISHVRSSRFGASVLFFSALLFSSELTLAQSVFTQQGPKLVGTLAVGAAGQGYSVALSADGKTAIVGGLNDNLGIGAVWVYTLSNGVWTQQGSKLVGTGASGNAGQGFSVALSGNGNTAMVGGQGDDGGIGATWVFTRRGTHWTQQGAKLVGNDAVGNALQGHSVALSTDGNTAIVGGFEDNSNTGAAWVYTRSGDVWTQQGKKLVAVGSTFQGQSVALSADGNTAIVGAVGDNSGIGAAWVYTRSGDVWTQQDNKLVGIGATGHAGQGYSVALSADGSTAIESGPGDNANFGAMWVFTRSRGVWTQQGNKLVGIGAVYTRDVVYQGISVALSADGNTAIEGGYLDNGGIGATWAFTRSGGVWTQQGNKLVGIGAVGNANQGISVALSGRGNTAFVGGAADDAGIGAAWVFVERTKADCKDGGWLNFIGPPGPFTSQGQCVSYFAKLSNQAEGGHK
jgi:hypothetical protein